MSLILDDVPPAPHERFPQAVVERRFAIVRISELCITDIINSAFDDWTIQSNVEGLP